MRIDDNTRRLRKNITSFARFLSIEIHEMDALAQEMGFKDRKEFNRSSSFIERIAFSEAIQQRLRQKAAKQLEYKNEGGKRE